MSSTALAIVPFDTMEIGALSPLAQRTREFMAGSRAPSTLRGYKSDWREFRAWCADHGLSALPAEADTIALYLADRSSALKVGSLQRRCSAIGEAHRAAGYDQPSTASITVRTTMAGIRRALGVAQIGKSPALTEHIQRICAQLPSTMIGTRDRALLLIGFAGAFRRSELVGLDVQDLDFQTDGLVVNLRRSKTDQEGAGRKIGIPFGSNPQTCPVRSLRAWMEAATIGIGPLFRSVNRHGQVQHGRLCAEAVALVVKKRTKGIGLDAAKYSAHSLRAGLVTSAAIAGVSDRSIMQQTGHKSHAMLMRYIRDANLFRENAAAKVGL